LAALDQFLTTGLDEALARPAPTEPEQRALALFESLVVAVPAYRVFLAEHDVDPAAVRTIDDFRMLPLLTVRMQVCPAAVVLTQLLTGFGPSTGSVGRSAAGLVLHSPGVAV